MEAEKKFEKASRMKLRFTSSKGFITTEDLWDIPLVSKADLSLDNMAKAVNRAIKLNEDESFVTEKNSVDAVLELKLDIIKYIIQVKLQEAKAAETNVILRAKIQKLQAIIVQKEDESLEGQSIEELTEELKKLQEV